MAQKSEKKCKKKCRAPRLLKKMAQKSEKKCKKKCLLTRAEWFYILVEGRGNLGPKQRGNLRTKQCFRL